MNRSIRMNEYLELRNAWGLWKDLVNVKQMLSGSETLTAVGGEKSNKVPAIVKFMMEDLKMWARYHGGKALERTESYESIYLEAFWQAHTIEEMQGMQPERLFDMVSNVFYHDSVNIVDVGGGLGYWSSAVIDYLNHQSGYINEPYVNHYIVEKPETVKSIKQLIPKYPHLRTCTLANDLEDCIFSLSDRPTIFILANFLHLFTKDVALKYLYEIKVSTGVLPLSHVLIIEPVDALNYPNLPVLGFDIDKQMKVMKGERLCYTEIAGMVESVFPDREMVATGGYLAYNITMKGGSDGDQTVA